MAVGSLEFVVCLCAGIVLFHLMPVAGLRRCLLTAANLIYLAPLVPNLRSAAWIAGLLLGSFTAIRLLRARPAGVMLATAVLTSVALFAVLKGYAFIEWFHLSMGGADGWIAGVQLIGLSYMLFRFLHLAVDQVQGQAEEVTFLCYLNYQAGFLTLVAGPIQRYNDFRAFWRTMGDDAPGGSKALDHWRRLGMGMLKMSLLAPAVQSLYLGLCAEAPSDAVRQFVLHLYGFPAYLFLNFSGYTDVVVAAASLLGWRLPENFDRPYLARNINDFWNRWHISLTHWVRDYFFMTGYKAAATRFPRWTRMAGYGMLLLALVVTGLWHGTTAGFAVFGLLHGLGAVATQFWGDTIRDRHGAAGHKRYIQNRSVRIFATVVTFHYVCFTFLFFDLDVTGAWRLITNLGGSIAHDMPVAPAHAAVFLLTLVIGATIVGLAAWAKDEALPRLDRLVQAMLAPAAVLGTVVAVQIALVVFWLLLRLLADLPEPAVVYQRF